MKKNISTTRSAVILTLLSIVLSAFYNTAVAQDSSSKRVTGKGMNNIIKYNVSGMLLYDKSLQFGYERILNSKHSFSVFGGVAHFPTLLAVPALSAVTTSSRGGFTLGADYRFYLQKENKYEAPHGIYLAPFIANYNFKTDRTATFTDTEGESSPINLTTKSNFLNIGCQLGYQFVMKKHFVVDVVMFGPALTSYKFSAAVDGQLTDAQKEKLNGEVIGQLIDRMPLLNDLIDAGSASKSGVESFWSAGFRYNISIGYRF